MYDMPHLKKLDAMKEAVPDGMAAFFAFDAAAFKEGALPVKVKELMALAVATTTQCPYCIEIHRKKAVAAGATTAEITESVLVAAAIRAGGAIVHGTHTV